MSPSAIAEALLAHFDRHQRDLPWRRTADPYAVWVSEVMLQQTRVETVVPYYQRWMRRFPSVDRLAEADLDDVLLEWKGLGYYSRARNLHRAARVVRERHGGTVPETVDGLRSLPGVGEYTAGAVASIAHGAAAPAVDGNVRRVLSRLHDLEAPTAAHLRDLAARLVPEDRPGDFNQALMELGATICTPRSPRCEQCPISAACTARARGVQEQRPLPRKQRPVPEETVETAVVVRGGAGAGDDAVIGEGQGQGDAQVLLVRRPEAGLLGGMWEFPGDGAEPRVARLIRGCEPLLTLEPVPHVFSHKRVTYLPTVYRAVQPMEPVGGAWVAWGGLGGYALPVAQQKIAARARTAWEGGDVA